MKITWTFSITIAFIALFYACGPLTDPQTIVDRSIAYHGGANYHTLKVEFDFRGRHYTSARSPDEFMYTRSVDDSVGRITDYLKNSTDFKREINGIPVFISNERRAAYTSSVNSVLYFFQLPYGLNDPAVNKQYLGESVIEDQPYYKVQITFDQEGGGEDYEDVFVYWIHQDSFSMDYIAYSYEERDGIGTRFRKAFNQRKIGGIMVQDYINYKPGDGFEESPLENHDELFIEGNMKELSKIVNENVQVEAAQS